MSKDTHIKVSIYDPDYSRKQSLLGTEEKGGHRTFEIDTPDPQVIAAVVREFLQVEKPITPSKIPRQVEALPPSPQSVISVSSVTPRKKVLGIF
jgi:hypothetical protein